MFGAKLELLHGLDEQLLIEQEKPFNIFSDNFVVVPEASLAADRFTHLQPKFDHLKNYLAHEIKQQTAGVNILVYGPPGTGKTEFARTLAKTIDAHLFEIAFAYRNGQRIEGARRLSSYALSQQILAQRGNSLIVFDEIEDIDAPFEDDDDIFASNRGRRQNRKGWFNKLLETNAVPAIWISNRIRHIDPAHLRRFNYHLHIDVPPASVRTSMLAEQVKPLGVAETWCRRMAINNRLEPAMIARATSVVSAMRDAGVTAEPEGLLEEVITASLSAQHIRHSTSPIPVESIQYRLDAINAGSDLSVIVNGLLAHPHARLCLYGPPGTGKSAFALHLAQQLGMPAHIRRASDILGAYVGETEQNIAEMFRRAKLDNAVLILDEADTFLFSRASAHRHWEVSAVNELLTQMEAFEGLFVATTNSINALDAASMRRFDAKVEFRYLKKAQIALLLREACELLKIETADCDGAVAGLRNLTPGDFATVVRQARFSPVKGLQDLIGRLDSEVRHKLDGDMRSIGFVTSVAA
jgi:SpoVK/Ycf46/Vps4 family AAA+-type ATPase